MIAKRKFFFLFFALLVFTISGLAQERDSIPPKKNVKIIESKDIPLDTTAMDMKGVEQMEKMQSTQPLNDNPLVLVKDGDQGAYNLQDHPEAAKYDSLWMKELYESASLYDDMYKEVSTLDPEKQYDIELNTDTLKMRLELLNQKTPFNVVQELVLQDFGNSCMAPEKSMALMLAVMLMKEVTLLNLHELPVNI